MDVITELAKFPGHIQLKLFLYRMESRRAAFVVNGCEAFAVMRHIRRQRKAVNLSLQWPVCMKINTVRCTEDFAKELDIPDYLVCVEGEGLGGLCCYRDWYEAPKKTPDETSLEELREKRGKEMFRMFGVDRKGYGKEIQRRERHMDDDGQLEEPTTLYDLLMKE